MEFQRDLHPPANTRSKAGRLDALRRIPYPKIRSQTLYEIRDRPPCIKSAAGEFRALRRKTEREVKKLRGQI